MSRSEFFEWLDTIIDKGNSDWERVWTPSLSGVYTCRYTYTYL